jgi:hypothetical protein
MFPRAMRSAHRAAGSMLRIPKLRAGSFLPSLLERRRRMDQPLFAVIMEAYLHGTSTRKVDDLVKAQEAAGSNPAIPTGQTLSSDFAPGRVAVLLSPVRAAIVLLVARG